MTREKLFCWVGEQYGTEPEYLWEKYPNFAVLRNNAGKWYAIVMNIPAGKLGLPGEHTVNVVNVKCDPMLIGSLRMKEGFYPAYHMNKEQWISIALDGAVSDSEIQTLIDISFRLTDSRKNSQRKRKENAQ